jgi:hypothetical protein
MQRNPISDLTALIARYEAGESYEDIARSVGIGKMRLRDALAAAGVLRTRSEAVRLAMPRERPWLRKDVPGIDALAARYNAGESVFGLARVAGVRHNLLAAALERAGVQLRRRTAERMLTAFWEKVEKTDGCWLWRGALNTQGYGNLRRDGKWHRAHRYAYELEHGPIPPGMELCHRCDNPLCVRPSHMFVGTHLDNVRDMQAKRRNAHGERHGTAKLTDAQVYAIRGRYDAGDTRARIGAEFGLNYQTVWKIGTRRSWKHLPEQRAS